MLHTVSKVQDHAMDEPNNNEHKVHFLGNICQAQNRESGL